MPLAGDWVCTLMLQQLLLLLIMTLTNR